jgi:ABC-2 type transport system permease protein
MPIHPSYHPKHGTLSAFTVLFFATILILVNILFSAFPLRINMTRAQIYSLSAESKALIAQLQTPITISYLVRSTDLQTAGILEVHQTLSLYATNSYRITYEVLHPDEDPLRLARFIANEQQLEVGSIIISSDKFFKIIGADELISYYFGSSGGAIPLTLNVENRISNAIQYVNSGISPLILVLEGHNELKLDDFSSMQSGLLRTRLENDNYRIENGSLNTTPLTGDIDIVMILSPKTDLTSTELAQLLAFVQRGGALYISMTLNNQPLPLFTQLLQSLGMRSSNSMVIEQSSDKLIATDPNRLAFTPTLLNHPITNLLLKNQLQPILSVPLALTISSTLAPNVRVLPLLESSASAVAAELVAGEIKHLANVPPFHLALASTLVTDGLEGRTYLTTGDLPFLRNPANEELMMQALVWLSQQTDHITAPVKNIYEEQMRGMLLIQAYLLASFFTLVIPLFLVLAGFIIGYMRSKL